MPKWQKGQSGNPAGRVKGAPVRTTKLRNQLESKASELVDAAIQLALSGDTAALKLCLERILPALRPRDLPQAIPIDTAATLPDQGRQILTTMADGTLTVADATALLSALASQAKLVESIELEERITRLEQQQ